MKKEIMHVINTPETSIKCTPYGRLRHYIVKIGSTVYDHLEISFSIERFRSISYKINSRDYEGVVNDISGYLKEYLDTVSAETSKAFENGILN